MLLTKVSALYKKQESVLTIDRHYFSTPLEEMQNLSNVHLQQYISFYTPLIADSIKQAKKFGPLFCPINDYFPTISNESANDSTHDPASLLNAPAPSPIPDLSQTAH